MSEHREQPVAPELQEILREAAEILSKLTPETAPECMRSPIVDELQGFADMLAAAPIQSDGWNAAIEAAAHISWPAMKVWSSEEQQAMSEAYDRASAKHGHYETLMAVGAAICKRNAAAIRALARPAAADRPSVVDLVSALQEIDLISQAFYEGGYGKEGDRKAIRKITELAQTWLRVGKSPASSSEDAAQQTAAPEGRQ
jgi:hypothetical protein